MSKKKISFSNRLQLKLLIVIILTIGFFTVVLLLYGVIETKISLKKQSNKFSKSMAEGIASSCRNFFMIMELDKKAITPDIQKQNERKYRNLIYLIGKSYSLVTSIEIYKGNKLFASYSALYDGVFSNKPLVVAEKGVEYIYPMFSLDKHKIGYVKVVLKQNILFEDYLGDMQAVVYPALILLFVISGFLFMLIDKFILEPLRIIEKGTEVIAEGNLEYKIDVNSKDEIGLLAMAFNNMATKLKYSKEKIEAWNKDLERKVAERTKLLQQTNEELKRTQYELIQSGKMAAIGLLGAGIAHELNNPLVGIIGYVQLMIMNFKEGKVKKEEYENILQRLGYVESEAQRCKRIVDELLHFSRRNKDELHIVDIVHIIKLTISVMEYQIRKWNIDVQLELRYDKILISGNEDKLQQVFINLIANAHHAMVDGGIINIKVDIDKNEKSVEIRVADNGCGISEEKLNKIFGSFFSEQKDKNNLGLGLSITEQIIKMHNGKIRVESEVGVGTEFIIKLPLCSSEN